MPKVSVVMPLFNGVKFLAESIQSIKNQSYQNWEFIIVNEFGSEDGSKELLEKYANEDERIRVIQNTERLGLAESLNQGIAAANGVYIARVDVDDPSYPERLEKQVKYMDEHPEVVLCGTIQRSVTPTDKNIQWVSTDWDSLKASMIFGCEISHCSVMIRKKYFVENGLKYDKNVLAEDYDLWTKIIYNAKIVNLDEVLVDHRWGFENISIQKGERLREESREISSRVLKKYFAIDIVSENIDKYLLSGWNSKPVEYAVKNRERFLKDGFRLLDLIVKRNDDMHLINSEALKKVLSRRWNWICESCGISFNKNLSNINNDIPEDQPLVTVVLPVYNSVTFLRQAIDSILNQSYRNWELLLINEYGSDDGSVEVCKWYELEHSRIYFIQNEKKLGLGNSINIGLKKAKGKYIARLDADDIAHTLRFEKQVNFLEKHPKIGICGTWQHHFGNTDWIHKPSEDPEQCKANLLFWCDLCHSTLMIRKETIEKNDLYFDSDYMAEDFELWSRAVRVTQISNIPEVLGEYRCGDDNITISKWDKLREESGHIVAKQLKENLHLVIPDDKHYLLNGWGNIYTEVDNCEKERMLLQLKDILLEIWNENNKIRFYKKTSLLGIINSKWNWAKNNEDWHITKNPYCIERVFDEHYTLPIRIRMEKFMIENKGIKAKAKKCLKWILKPVYRPIISRIIKMEERICDHINNMTWNRVEYLVEKLDARIWKAERRIINNEELLSDLGFNSNLVSVKSNEKIRIVFIFQVASFWPSIESLYEAVQTDVRFDARLLCYDEAYDKTIKTDSARRFLKEKGLNYVTYEKFDIEMFCPHVVVVQTPYDTNRTQKYTTTFMKNKGYRVVYIPYGIEIAATEHAKRAHFTEAVVKNCWRLYTLSETMREDYFKYCANATAVRVLGLPKFDAFFHPESYSLSDEIVKMAGDRKLVLWKVHFPKIINEKGKNILVTPYIKEYISFAKCLKEYDDLFFIFMPHPRFKEFNEEASVKRELETLMTILENGDNVYIDNQDDYRNSLINVDYIIVDRSAVMVEAGGVGVPVMYMYNPDFNEPLTEAIGALVSSYYQGTSCKDMQNFLEICRNDLDPLKQKRDEAFRACIPYFDGECGTRIKEDIIKSLGEEKESITGKNGIIDKVNELDKKLDARIWKAEQRLQKSFDEVHTQVDFTYRDILIILEKQLNFVGKHNIELNTKYQCAFNSNDYLYPRGTANDNTRYPRFIKKCESILRQDRGLSFLDLGCSGGGMVLDAIIRGHLGIGLEGSDWSLVQQRAEWRLLRENLFTCDITKPFLLVDKEKGEVKQFDVITAWEVLEHIKEEDLKQMFINIKKHLSENGIFVGSISSWNDIDAETGINWHVTVQPKEWWLEKLHKWGFEEIDGEMQKEDLARGGINHPIFYKEPSESSHKDEEFFLVLKSVNSEDTK